MKDQQPHILIVDDELFIRDAVKLYLETNGFRVTTADGSKEALQVLNTPGVPVDVAILDLVMPGVHGIDLLKQFKVLDPGIEVIIATGCGSMNSAVEALRHGAFDYITKPFVDFDEDLLKSVRRALEARREKASDTEQKKSVPTQESELARRLSLYEQLNDFVESHAGKHPGDETWAAIWTLASNGFGADAALLADRVKGDSRSPIRSWGFDPDEQLPVTLDPQDTNNWSEVLHVPIYHTGDLPGQLLLLFYKHERQSSLKEAPHGLLAAALGAVLSGAGAPLQASQAATDGETVPGAGAEAEDREHDRATDGVAAGDQEPGLLTTPTATSRKT